MARRESANSFAWRDYGNASARRLLELAEAYDLPYALLVNTRLRLLPADGCRVFSRGDEIVDHEPRERQGDMAFEDERADQTC
jgi:hypothetical protein